MAVPPPIQGTLNSPAEYLEHNFLKLGMGSLLKEIPLIQVGSINDSNWTIIILGSKTEFLNE